MLNLKTLALVRPLVAQLIDVLDSFEQLLPPSLPSEDCLDKAQHVVKLWINLCAINCKPLGSI